MDGHYCHSGTVLDMVERRIAKAFAEKRLQNNTGYYSKEHKEKSAYHMIPKHNGFFDSLVRLIRDKFIGSEWDKRKFIDVGAGCGFRVLQAQQYNFNATGVEFYRRYVKFAKRYLDINLIQDDAFNIDYSDYQVVYFYHPIADHKLEAKLEEKIHRDIKKGTYVLTGMSASQVWLDKDKYEAIEPNCAWKKK